MIHTCIHTYTHTVIYTETASYWLAIFNSICIRCVTSAHGCCLGHMLNLPICKTWKRALLQPSGHMSADLEHCVRVGTSSMSLRVCVHVCMRLSVHVRHAHSWDCSAHSHLTVFTESETRLAPHTFLACVQRFWVVHKADMCSRHHCLCLHLRLAWIFALPSLINSRGGHWRIVYYYISGGGGVMI
jgi:hypothetical protein